MQQFGIYSPVLGKREDIPNIFLEKAMTPETQNMQFWLGKVRTSNGRSPEIVDASGDAIAFPDGKPAIKYFNHQADSGTKFLLGFTEDHAYLWTPASWEWRPMCTASATVKNWSVAQMNGSVIAVNNLSAGIYSWDGGTGTDLVAFAPDTNGAADPITRAKYVINYESHIVFLNYSIVTAPGQDFYGGFIMSDLDDWTNFDLAGAGDQSAYYSEGTGQINGVGIKGDLLYVFKTRSARIWWYTGTAAIMNSRGWMGDTGCFAPDSIGNDAEGNLYYLASDATIKEVDAGTISQPIINSVRDITQDEAFLNRAYFHYVAEYNEIWFAVPTGVNEVNNKVLCFQLGSFTWYERPQAVTAFGTYEYDSSYTWDNQPEGTWNDWAGVWNDAVDAAGWQSDICGDSYGYTYLSHASGGDRAWNGSAMADSGLLYNFVMTTDLANKQGLRMFKRLLYMYGYFTSIGGDPVSVYIKEDNAAAWVLAGTITTTGTAALHIGELALDFRARHFLIKIESTSAFEFLGCELEFNLAGLR